MRLSSCVPAKFPERPLASRTPVYEKLSSGAASRIACSVIMRSVRLSGTASIRTPGLNQIEPFMVEADGIPAQPGQVVGSALLREGLDQLARCLPQTSSATMTSARRKNIVTTAPLASSVEAAVNR